VVDQKVSMGDVSRGQRSWGDMELEMTKSSIWARGGGGTTDRGLTFSGPIEFDDKGYMVVD